MPRSRDRLRSLCLSLIAPNVFVVACAPPSGSDDRAALEQELWANQMALEAAADSLAHDAEMALYHLHWMEGIEDAGSYNLWLAMGTLTVRPTVAVHRSTFDDLAQGALATAVSDPEVRRSIIQLYADLAGLADEAELEYRALAEHYESILGPGEWRDLFSVRHDEEVYAVDYRKALADLVADNHEARLRAVVRAHARYAERLAAVQETLQTILTALARTR